MRTIMSKGNLHIYRLILIGTSILLSFIYSAYAEPEIFWEGKFDEEIVSVSLSVTTDMLHKTRVNNNNKTAPSGLILTANKVKILRNGKIRNDIHLKQNDTARLSDNGDTVAIMRKDGLYIYSIDNAGKENLTGRILSKSVPNNIFSQFPFWVSPNGERIVLNLHYSNEISFFNKKGKHISSYKLNDSVGIDLAFSGNGEYILANIPHSQLGNSAGYLLFFDKDGRILWRFDHEGTDGILAISREGSAIAFTTETTLYSLDKKGSLIFKKELIPGGINLAISDNGERLAVSRKEDHTVTLINNRTGNILWKQEITGFDRVNSPFSSISFSDDSDYILIIVNKHWKKSNKEASLFLINKNGEIIRKDVFNEGRLTAKFVNEGRSILINGDNRVILYGIGEKT